MKRQERGSALLTTIIFVTIILLVTSAILFYASYSHRRATFVSRASTELSCAESGLQIARAYFADPVQQPQWNTYLSDPSDYNPVPATWNTFTRVPPPASADTASSAFPSRFTSPAAR